MKQTLLDLKDLDVGYSQPLIKNINLRVQSGEVIAITGPSGVGKTTLLRTISGLVRPLKGAVELRVENEVASVIFLKNSASFGMQALSITLP